MKKFRLLLALLFASIGSVQGAWAERVAPTEPTVTLTDGGEYYLYNVGYDNAVHYNSAASTTTIYPRAFSSHATKVTINTTDDGYYTIKLTDANRYFYRSSTSTIQANTSSKTSFSITKVDGGYTFQTPKSSYYNESQYMGFVSNSDYLRGDATTNTVWKILPAEEESFNYIARLRLYNCLCRADEYHFCIDNFEAIYANEASTNGELTNAANELGKALSMSAGYQAPWWNERPILFYTADGDFGQSSSYTWTSKGHSKYFASYINNGQSSISATVFVEEPSTLVYGLYGSEGDWFKVYVDGVEVRSLNNMQYRQYPSDKTHTRFFEELEPGLHTITWTASRNSTSSWTTYYLYNVGVMSKPQITVSLLEPGSLGTEVLYNTDHIKNVRRLKVKGAMNGDDWGRIKMMSTLLELDLSEAQFTKIPANQFKVSSSDTTMNFLHKVVLPEGLTTIGDQAFYESFVEDINLPSTMKRVGKEAFYHSHVKELIMPDDMTDFYGGNNYGYCFYQMMWLKKLVLPKNLTKIPRYTFNNCAYITEAVMPEKLQTVGESAFSNCHRLQTALPEGLKTIEEYGFNECHEFNSPLPSTLTTIGDYAFSNIYYGYTSLVIPQSVTSIGSYAFQNCSNLETAELSVNQYSLANGVFQGCSKLKTVKLNSPTVTTISSTYPLSDITTVTLQVPHYLVNEYKLHRYWYNAKAIEPFDYSSIDDISLNGNLILNHERFGGQPSIKIASGNYLKINGDREQKFNEIWIGVNGFTDVRGQLLNNCDNVTAFGDNRINYGTSAKKWYFISLPFDLDMTRIAHGAADTQYAIRYYDGAGRAANGKSGNWKNVDRTSIIPAGTGFIYQTNIDIYTYFYAADTENKYGTLRTTEFIKTLDVNASETASNKGWNLVGNPYQCYYNSHCLNFTAPITVWNGSTYKAYSLTDDDYAIRPNEAFFVQCPNEEYNTLGFPLQGRQLTSVIESQNAAPRMYSPEIKTRQVVNLTVSDGEWEDQTRVVLNEKASMAYETACDASKFISMDGSVPQLYTIGEEDTWYAINERPLGEGTVALGFYAGHDGDYTISLTRCDAEQVFVIDNLTGMTVDITGGTYTFSANAGTDNTRFMLSFVSNETTGIKDVDNNAALIPQTEVYSLDGKFMGTDASQLRSGVYMVRQGKKVSKVVVR